MRGNGTRIGNTFENEVKSLTLDKPRIPFGSALYLLFEYGLVVLGSFIVALSFNLFLNPNRIAAGGVSGISTICTLILAGNRRSSNGR